MNQRAFDNQPSGWVGAKEASRLLGVKQRTVYAYASRGLLGAGKRGPGQPAKYLRSAVLRLKTRAEARSGHTAVAASALRWGEPVLDSAITQISPDGPVYRGHRATSLAQRSFEAVAELLWSGTLPSGSPRWPAAAAVPAVNIPLRAPLLPSLAQVAGALGLAETVRYGLSPEVEQQRARQLIQVLAAAVCLPHAPKRFAAAQRQPTVAQQLFFALTGKAASRAQQALVDRCLVLSADHELNASAFAARVTAGAGADLHACLTAALAALSGPRHGGACDRVEAMVVEVLASSPQQALTARLARGEDLPGFYVGPYPQGDPRTPPLLEGAKKLRARFILGRDANARLDAVLAVGAWVRQELGEAPALDLGLVAAAISLGFPPGAAAGLFAIGRAAGWVAHVLEQRLSGVPIRPRARYVGP